MKTALKLSTALLWCFILMPFPWPAHAQDPGPDPITPYQFHVIEITNLQNTITNIGSFGFPTKPCPSCEWPADSDNFYLYDAELWVGGLVNDQVAVTTGRLSGTEWAPQENIAIAPEENAFSDEDTYTRYDDLSSGRREFISHTPLGIEVSQRTLAWAGADFIVHDLVIENVGDEVLADVYIGLCWDFNIASPAGGSCGEDDLVGYDDKNNISYMYDDDGDRGLSPGYVGGAFLNAPMTGHGWFSRGNDPRDDADRYALLRGGFMPDPDVPGDYRLVHSVGPFDLPPGRKVPLIYALAIGQGRAGLRESVAAAVEAVQRDVIATADSTIFAGELHEIPVIVGETKKAMGRVQLAVDWEFCDLGLTVVDPQGTEITPEMAVPNPFISYIAEPHRKAYEIINPLPGQWKLRIRYLEGPGQFPYRFGVTVFGLPWGYGPPLESFQVTRAHIRFAPNNKGLPGKSSFTCSGQISLREGFSFDPASDPVAFRMGPYQEIIPPGSFVSWGDTDCDLYIFCRMGPGSWGLCLFFLDLTNDRFHVLGRGVNMMDTQNPVLVRLAIGPVSGFEDILMREVGNWWTYSSP